MRESLDNFYMKMAYLVSERSTCLRRKVGAVIVKNKIVLSTGYNGAPSGIEHCSSESCVRKKLNVPSGERQELCRGSHSEMNAISQAARTGTNIDGSTLYCTTYPCAYCAKAIVNAGITRVVYTEGYPDKLTEEMLKNIKVEKYIF